MAMAEWLITDAKNDQWSVRLGECSKEHADSVLANLLHDLACPNNLQLHDLTPPEPEPEPEPEPLPEPEPEPEPEPQKRSWLPWRR